jgi:cob(I)alamin adenosyltransferase
MSRPHQWLFVRLASPITVAGPLRLCTGFPLPPTLNGADRTASTAALRRGAPRLLLPDGAREDRDHLQRALLDRRRRDPDDDDPGPGQESGITSAVGVKARGRSVGAIVIDLDGEPKLRPKEIDAMSPERHLGPRLRQAGRPDQPQQLLLRRRLRPRGTGVILCDPRQPRPAGMAAGAHEHIVHLGQGEDPPCKQRLVEQTLNVTVWERGRDIEHGPRRRGHPNAVVSRKPPPSPPKLAQVTVNLTRIYTRLGDSGETHLGDMSRVPKTHPRIEAYGTVDELNAHVGLALTTDRLPEAYVGWLRRIQNELFDVGADIAAPEDPERERLRVIPEQTEWLEQRCDEVNATLKPLKSFVLPGGTPAAAQLHVCRTVCRRAERLAIACGDELNPEVVRYLNRLSDLLFILSRGANAGEEPLWEPGQSRSS